MSTPVDHLVRGGLDTTNQLAAKVRHDPSAITGARDGHVALRTSVGQANDQAAGQRVNLANASSGGTSERAVATSQDMENHVRDLLDESAEIEGAVAEAAEVLHVGQIRNDQVRDQIVREIAASMKALQATGGIQPPESRAAAARQVLLRLQTKIGQLTGQAATFSEETLGRLTDLGGRLGGSDATTTSSATAAPSAPQAFNSNGAHASGGGGGDGGGGFAGKPRLPVAIPPQPGSGVAINLPGGKTVMAPNETAAKAVRAALSQLGVPYVWGGTARGQGLDCSGLTMTSYQDAGLQLPRTARQQTVGAEVPSIDQLLPGDLVVWSGHVAMVIGDGQMVEAGDPVQVSAIRTTNSGQQFIGFYRPTG
ncbi:C40 family peptidase [Amycolatopsis jiangsuensis]|uniref:Cell wall-associated NlpC family hydrolase n=1 Tax=Amycolatopsis jiangsuensis TaxID=1181879 RepID=A0A840IXJ8_9PSEU|nr:C40 family peptidase [Amycolatopsis jiangsuensis]MBB4685878.1 cell wall-associated NlpC family hydrolase [Amycolatopsis jiangsuensis]